MGVSSFKLASDTKNNQIVIQIQGFQLKSFSAEIIELIANAKKARKDIAMEPLIMSVNLSLPNMEIQASLRAAADDDADIRR
ncbi:hypothetical protein IEQ34_020984 [Dendrobium chrysotoxum]|uniref:Uncharacterized protein n=1 Tax=Dendrobium chrysotoxum TaxID=161865 RepID=A0AAV7FIJ8_DENCH|nr:hypothetical protein IEQ34_026650 [Dendrobium chrysotoxum]KAH0450292.1 hypothetical protein IEQ34_020984 [Dendrobium chrysotoxum]